jgi:hypothetical protein
MLEIALHIPSLIVGFASAWVAIFTAAGIAGLR